MPISANNIHSNTFNMHYAENEAFQHQAHIPSSYIKSKVQEFAGSAKQFANQFFEQPAVNNTEHVKVVHHYHSYSPYYSYWNQPPVVIIGDRIPRSRNSDSDSENDKNMKLLGVVAVIGGLIATYTVGLAWTSMKEAGEELEQTKQFEESLSSLSKHASPEDKMLIAEAKEVSTLKGRICERITNSATWNLRLRLAAAAGLAMTGYGALMVPTVAPAINAGLALTVASLGAILFKAGVESNDTANIRDARALKSMSNNLLKC